MTKSERQTANAIKAAMCALFGKSLDKPQTFNDGERQHTVTYKQIINAIPLKYIFYVDSIKVDSDGIWIWLKEQYDFDDCGCCGGTCHVDTLKQIKEQFSYGIIIRNTQP